MSTERRGRASYPATTPPQPAAQSRTAASPRSETPSGREAGTFTQMGRQVDDIEATVAELKARGVEFEEVDVPGVRTRDGIAGSRATTPARAPRESAGVVSRQRRQHA